MQGIDPSGCQQGARVPTDNADIDSLLSELESLIDVFDPESSHPARDPGGRPQGKPDTSR